VRGEGRIKKAKRLGGGGVGGGGGGGGGGDVDIWN